MLNLNNYNYDTLLTNKANFYNCLLDVVQAYQNNMNVILSEDDLKKINTSTDESLYWSLLKEAEATYYAQLEDASAGETVAYTAREEQAMRSKLRKDVDELKRSYAYKIKVAEDSRKSEAKMLKKQRTQMQNEIFALESKDKSTAERKQLQRKKADLDALTEKIAQIESAQSDAEIELNEQISNLQNELEATITAGKNVNASSDDKYKVTLSIEDEEDIFNMLLLDINNEVQMIQRNAQSFISDEAKYTKLLNNFVAMLNYDDPAYATRIWDGWLRNAKYALSHLDNCRGFLINIVSESHKIGKSELLQTLSKAISNVAKCPARTVDLSQTLSQLNKWPATTGVNYIDEIKSSTNFDAEFLKTVLANNELSLNLKYKASNVRTINHSANLATSNFEFSIAKKNDEGVDCRVANLIVNGDQPKFKVTSNDTTYSADIYKLCEDLFMYCPFERRDIDVLDIIAGRYTSRAYQNFVRDTRVALNAYHYRKVGKCAAGWLNENTFSNILLQAASDGVAGETYVVGTKTEIAHALAKVINKTAGANKIDREAHYIALINDVYEIKDDDTMIYSLSDKFTTDVINYSVKKQTASVSTLNAWSMSPAFAHANDIEYNEIAQKDDSAKADLTADNNNIENLFNI